LQRVEIPPSLKEIGVEASGSSGLDDVIFEEGSKLETIGDWAFYKSENLKTSNIPLGVVFDWYAFKKTGCPEDIFTPGATIVDCKILTETKGLRGNEVVSSE